MDKRNWMASALALVMWMGASSAASAGEPVGHTAPDLGLTASIVGDWDVSHNDCTGGPKQNAALVVFADGRFTLYTHSKPRGRWTQKDQKVWLRWSKKTSKYDLVYKGKTDPAATHMTGTYSWPSRGGSGCWTADRPSAN